MWVRIPGCSPSRHFSDQLAYWVIPEYATGMKLAISIPDPLAEAVDAFAKHRGLPRSRIIASAIADYLARQAPSRVTERLDAVYALERDSLDTGVAAAGRRLLRETAW